MNSQNDITPRQSGISGETALAIISVALAALWIAFAFYHGTSPDTNGNRILLLHPLVPIALIALLIRIYRWVDIKFVVQLEIIMIGLWLFVRMLGVLMPFILGFGFAYLFRFLWRALPFEEYYQRVIATVLIVLVCSGVLIFTGIGVGNQVSQMAKGLQKFYHESLLPLIVGEDFVELVYDKVGEEQTLFLATDHGIYFYKIVKDPETKKEKINDRKGITNGKIIGKKIRAISVNKDYIYAGTDDGVYRCSKEIVQVVTGKKDNSTESTSRIGFLQKFWHVVIGKKNESVIALPEELEWTKIDANIFDTRPVQAINTPSWNSNIIYVGTNKGLFFSDDSGETWGEEKSYKIVGSSIVHITSIEKYEGASDDVPKYFKRKDIPMYVASIAKTVQTTSQPEQEEDISTDDYQNAVDQESLEQQNSTTQDTNSKKTEDPDEIKTVVHKRVNPSEKWEELRFDKDVPQINVLVATDNESEELCAGTVDGIYCWYKHKKWEEMPDAVRLPQSISLLASAPSGLYTGNESVIYFGSNETKTWRSLIFKENGILAYRDEEIVRQFQEYLTKKIPGWTASGGAFVKWLSGLAGSIAFQFGGLLATVFLAFIVFVYASQGFDKYYRGFIGLVPERHRETAMAYLREIDRNMHQFLKGQFTVIVIISIISCIVYRIIGVPFALLVGILAGLCNAIPTFGPFIGGGFAYIAMLMGLAASDFSSTGFLIRCVFVLGAILGIQTIDNSLISPKVMSNAVDVDPLLIMFSVIVGASILGFWGVLLAIPIIVVIKSIIAVSKSAANDADAQPAQEPS